MKRKGQHGTLGTILKTLGRWSSRGEASPRAECFARFHAEQTRALGMSRRPDWRAYRRTSHWQ